jgi:hypothetical protein
MEQRQLKAFTGYESFLYLLAELEMVIAGGTVQWTIATADAARRRLEVLALTIRRETNTVDQDPTAGP